MPTPSEPPLRGEWAASTDTPKRSVFGNYRSDALRDNGPAPVAQGPSQIGLALVAPTEVSPIQRAIDIALARSFLHRLLALAFADPTPDGWCWLSDASTVSSLRSAAEALGPLLAESSVGLIATLKPNGFEAFLDSYLATFGHAARGSCPLNEIEYGDIKADPLFQPHRLADLAAFYRAFGLEVAEDAGERQDHISLELEFSCVLAAKEAYALEYQLDAEDLLICRDAQRKFLREHLGRWMPAFTRRLSAAADNPVLGALARFTRTFVVAECERFGVNPGSEDLLLRPVDEVAERACDLCALAGLPPGAHPAETTL